jgi:N-acetylneuraminic acid mutarotase
MCRPSRTIRSLASGFLIAIGLATPGLITLRAAVPTWTTVGSTSNALGGVVTLLENGRVLLTGGRSSPSGAITNRAELFDPTSNTWSLAGSMATVRTGHIAAALADGRVLVAGGLTYGPVSQIVTNGAEIYDPAADAWAGVASMIRTRRAAGAVVLADGRVLVVGGASSVSSGSPHADGEVYDPDTNTWTLTGATNAARTNAIAALLDDGRVLVAGGFNGAAASFDTAEVYDPAANAWSPVASMQNARSGPASVVLDDGRVLVFGGYDATLGTWFTDGEVYDPVTDSWIPTPSAGAVGGEGSAAALRTDGSVIAIGGSIGVNQFSTTAALYDPTSNTWSPSFPPLIPRYGSSAVPIPGARTLVTAGLSTQTDVFGAPNNAPTANAGPDQTVNGCVSCLGVVTLNASASNDLDGDALVYEWSEGASLLATTTDPVQVVSLGLGLGLHTLTLTVTDGAGGRAVDDVRVNVIDIAVNLGAALAQCQADQQALESGIETTLAAIEQNLRVEFKNPSFAIPGGTPQARLQNLGFAITSMTRGQKMALYRGLGGI